VLLDSELIYYISDGACDRLVADFELDPEYCIQTQCEPAIPEGFVAIAEGRLYENLQTINDLTRAIRTLSAQCADGN